MKRIGVFVCHCGINIVGTIDTKKVVEELKKYPGVAYATDYIYVCSDPGQNLIKDKIKEENLDAVIVAACSPSLHEQTFRRTVELAGLNPYQMESANIREQISWVHPDKEIGTKKAIQIIKSLVEKISLNEDLTPFGIPITRRAMVIGGGISGIQAALDIANSGYEVVLVEKEPSIGGHMIQLSETFPTLDCSQCIMTPKMVELNQHPNINLLAYSEVEDVSGYIGNFKVKVRKKARYVDLDKCTACDECTKVCPVEVPSDFDCRLATRKAAYRPFPQAIPNAFVIEKTEPAPCKITCPIHQDVPGYMAMVRVGKYAEAIDLIRKTNPLPSICGRVCYHPCEEVCRRLHVDESLSIARIKRFAADYALRSGEGVKPPEIEEQREEQVAIIGSGPAGLSAAHDLALLGYRSTIFEALPVAGGMLAVGIPDYRLPRDILQSDIDYIKQMGVEILSNIKIGKDLTISDLQDQGYKAIFIATGAHTGLDLDIPGKNLEEIYQGIDFLRQVNLKEKVKVGRRVAVIGGGNSAMDAARTALRLGAEEVKIIYRRSRQEMPASDEEIKETEEEGVEIHYLLAPTAYLGKEGKLAGLRLIRMELGEPDASGRRRPIPIEGSEHEIPIDTVILAIGQAPELTFMDAKSKFDLTRWNTLMVDDKTLATNIPGIFAGGDVESGPATVIKAIAAGKRAATSIHRYLRGELENYRSELEKEEEERKEKEEKPEPDWVEVYKERVHQERVKVPELPRDDRIQNFQEVSLGYEEKGAQEEASRCLACGTCVECMECVKACEPDAIDHQMKDEVEEFDVGAIVVATGYDLYPLPEIGEYGYGKYKDVIDGLQFERLLSASGPTLGQVRRPSDGKVPKEVVFIQCVRSRDQERGMPYCSKICCMYTAKHAMLYKHRVPDGQAYVFYMDIRAGGKGYEEFVQRATEEDEVLYLRGRVSKVFQDGDKLIVWGTDTLTGEKIEIAADLVVLATAMVPNKATAELVKKLKVPTDPYGFLNEAHPKLRPVEFISAGLYLAGCSQAPKDIPEAVAQAGGAASKVIGLLSREELFHDPAVTDVDEDICCGCGICVEVCPYAARTLNTEKKVVEVNLALCEGCGVCGAACPTGAAQPKNFTDKQMLEMVSSILRD